MLHFPHSLGGRWETGRVPWNNEHTEAREKLLGSYLKFQESHEFLSRRRYYQEYVVWSNFSDSLFQPPCFSDKASECCHILSQGNGKIFWGWSPGGQSKVIASCILGEKGEACVTLSGSIMRFCWICFLQGCLLCLLLPRDPWLKCLVMGEGSWSWFECNLMCPSLLRESHS